MLQRAEAGVDRHPGEPRRVIGQAALPWVARVRRTTSMGNFLRLFTILAATALPLWWLSPIAEGQGAPAPPVRFVHAHSLPLQPTLRLTGAIVAPRTSTVAGEVAGIVEQIFVREGNRVDQGSPLARLRQEPVELRLRAARAEKVEADARRAAAEQKLARYRELASTVISQQELDEARFELEAQQGRSARLEAMIAQLDRDLEQTTIRAPFPGVVTARHTHMGQWLPMGAPVVTVVSLAVLDVHLDVPAAHIGAVTVGREVEVRLVDAPGQSVTGTIRAIVPRADPQARTFPVYVALPSERPNMGVGMLAEVRLPTGRPQSTVVVPKDALITDGTRSHLFRLDDDDRVARLAVEMGEGAGDWVAIRGPVGAGDRIVVRGNERLSEGMAVRASVLEVPLP